MADINDQATADRLLQTALDAFQSAQTRPEPDRTWLIRNSQAASTLAATIMLRIKFCDDESDDDHGDHGAYEARTVTGPDISDVFPWR